MKELTKEEYQKVQYDILKEVDRYCSENNIVYYLSYGTLLGAVRHKGFIPWDDDIDIAMPMPDFLRFCREYNSEKYKVNFWERDSRYFRYYATVEDRDTYLKEETDSEYKVGINIDLAPIIGLPEDEKKAKRYFKRLVFLRSLLNLKVMKPRKGRVWYKELFLKASSFLLLPYSYKFINKKMQGLCLRYPYNDAKNVICVGSFNREKEVIGKEKLEGPLTRLQFESDEFMVPAGYDAWLKQIFGDYMKLPPVEKRVSHHTFVAYSK